MAQKSEDGIEDLQVAFENLDVARLCWETRCKKSDSTSNKKGLLTTRELIADVLFESADFEGEFLTKYFLAIWTSEML